MKKFICIFSAVSLLVGCSAGSNSLEKWQNYKTAQPLSHEQLKENQAQVVFYQHDDIHKPVHLYINGQYQGSLLKSSYSSTVVCAQPANITATFHQNVFNTHSSSISHPFQTGETLYLKLSTNKQGEPVFEKIAEQDAKNVLTLLKGKATHTISRVVSRNCK
ncbi:hypothetical protein BMT54_06955 [Pasteurellaceae bacterium 15-036681]|nr:hypothetical protein BMT54_06955 [Pasteurellaceae bacterium 15-036681]